MRHIVVNPVRISIVHLQIAGPQVSSLPECNLQAMSARLPSSCFGLDSAQNLSTTSGARLVPTPVSEYAVSY